jgi:lipocalin
MIIIRIDTLSRKLKIIELNIFSRENFTNRKTAIYICNDLRKEYFDRDIFFQTYVKHLIAFKHLIMKKIWNHLHLWVLALLPICGCSSSNSTVTVNDSTSVDNSTIEQLNITSFMGKWYEIARYENRFERGMTHVSATYTPTSNGKLQIINEGIKKGKLHKSKGRAFRPYPDNMPGRLRVSFFLWFYSDYYILEYDQVDSQYAVIGSSDPDYLWILYRKPLMPDSLLTNLLDRIQKRGYDTSKLLFVDQSSVNSSN